MRERGVPTAVHYPLPLDEQPAYRHLCRGERSLPNSRAAARTVLSLPMSADLTEDDARRAVAALASATRR
jgi:UDP-2-acetamido-2-deoxy-ribo-hexuluronate aminotransferase